MRSREEAVSGRLLEEGGDPVGLLEMHVVMGGADPVRAEMGKRGAGPALGPPLPFAPRGVPRVGEEQEQGHGQPGQTGRRAVLPQGPQELQVALAREARLDQSVRTEVEAGEDGLLGPDLT